ncbi:hypothetical protein BU026_11210 [Staphylococcus simulans]|uniref:hypothetical protein n=1 Tax=Staphylococcus simulans TaxID=1286 RepID=UPI000D1D7D15|nr:hypothetical protein [Staphylococcus simulans]PTJ30777.1 hypothetical protein BU026_11210 [Staphylococcus simulans]
MEIERIYICTSKHSKLNRIFLLQTSDDEKTRIFSVFKDSLEQKKSEEDDMGKLNAKSLIEDIPYFIYLHDIKEDDYLYNFKLKINELVEHQEKEVITFNRKIKGNGEVTNFEENEGIKFLVVQDKTSLYFLSISNNAVLKNKSILNISINENSTITTFPKGVQIPPSVTARLERNTNKLFVYDVNRFEQMLTLNENRKAKSRKTLSNFINGTYTVSKNNYIVRGLDDKKVKQQLLESARASRRLSKYTDIDDNYDIDKVKKAVSKLEERSRVKFDDNNKTIIVNQDSAKTFVAIIYNSIVERLITEEVETLF